MTSSDVERVIQTVFRIESARLIAGLTRVLGDVAAAEELAQDALVAALEHWPSSGVPDNPGAWLMATAKRRAIDELRHRKLLTQKHQALSLELQSAEAMEQARIAANLDAQLDDELGDDLLRLLFIACHPVLSMEARAALTLRLVGGLTTDEIARAFLVPEPTIAQRIVRAKRTLSEQRIPFETPRGPELTERLSSVLGVVYLIFNEGYSATTGDDLMRPALCEDALRLGRILAQLAPDQAEVHGLVALMELQASRAAARLGPDGHPVLLLEQNRGRWDRLLIQRGLSALGRAQELGGATGLYALQAAIAACHARATAAELTDWPRIAALYGLLVQLTQSPIVELNRAVAVGMAEGPAAGLGIVDRISSESVLAKYHLLPSVRGDLLEKLGRNAEAADEFSRAAELTRNARERQLLLGRAAACRNHGG